MAQIMSEVPGQPIRYQQSPIEALNATLTGHGVGLDIAFREAV
jgi:hypothetical protein